MSENTSILTPYAAAKYVNSQLKENGVDAVIPPQMMYNYTRARIAKNKAPFIEYNEKEGVVRKSLEEWTKAYVSKKLAASTVSVEA